MSPRTAIAVTVYNRAEYLPAALESLLGQSYRDFGLVLLDDCSTDGTPRILERYAAVDDRIVSFRNPSHLGLILTWRRAYELALEQFPSAEYFAWASDHDLWDPHWLETLVRELDRSPAAVLAYPASVRISATGELIAPPWKFSTQGLTSPVARLRRTCSGMGGRAGSMVYGLFRVTALEGLDVYAYVMEPDNLLLAELSVRGEFRQVPEVLWKRRFPVDETRKRHLASLFHGAPPWYAHLPAWIQNAPLVFKRCGARVGSWFVVASLGDMIRRWLRRAFLASSGRTSPAREHRMEAEGR
jgi:glycosyltransferase involved in cell wall biosynthesis